MQEIHEFDHLQECRCHNLAIYRMQANGAIWFVCTECFLDHLRQDLIESGHDYNLEFQRKKR